MYIVQSNERDENLPGTNTNLVESRRQLGILYPSNMIETFNII